PSSWTIAKSAISRGMKVRLTATATAGAGTGADACSTMTTSTYDTAPLNTPDPVITGGCTAGGPPCSFAVSSGSGVDQVADGWTYSWSVFPSTNVTPSTAATSTYGPVFTATGQ